MDVLGERRLRALVVRDRARAARARCRRLLDEVARLLERVAAGARRRELGDDPPAARRRGEAAASSGSVSCCMSSRRIVTPRPARSTSSGAWSDGAVPLRALRSMMHHSTRSATEARGEHQVDPQPAALVEVAGAVVPPAVELRVLVSGCGTRRSGPSRSSSASSSRSAGLTCVAPTNLAGSYTSRSSGAMLKSPSTTSRLVGLRDAVEVAAQLLPATRSLYW